MFVFILTAVLAYLGGALTIASPCILPVIPFVFARADRPFRSSGLPLLVGMALSFAVVSTLASVGGAWVVQANEYGRYAALALLALFAVTMLSPALSERLTRPLVQLGSRLSSKAAGGSSVGSSLLLGVATGLLWAPCAGPILGLVLTGAASFGGHLQSSVLLLAYALGAASSLAAVLLGGQKVLSRMKRSLGVEEKIRKGLGVAILVGVVVIGAGLDHGLLTHLSEGSTTGLEQGLISRLNPSLGASTLHARSASATGLLDEEGHLPALPLADTWVNSPPLTAASIRGKIVLVDFWTYSCINCLRTLPAVKAWYETYKNDGFIVIGVHTPEFAFERVRGNVEQAIKQLGITYPVALDNDYRVWNAFQNEYWPAHYLIDGKGDIRYHHFGEGDDAQTEKAIRALLAERGAHLGAPAAIGNASGVQAAQDDADEQSPETYLGSGRGEHYAGMVAFAARAAKEATLPRNGWDLAGTWDRSSEHVTLLGGTGSISYRFHARDAHLVLGPGTAGLRIPFRVLLDGKPVGDARGADLDAQGRGVVKEQRLYQLVRQHGAITDHVLRIEFEAPGVQAFAFTFG